MRCRQITCRTPKASLLASKYPAIALPLATSPKVIKSNALPEPCSLLPARYPPIASMSNLLVKPHPADFAMRLTPLSQEPEHETSAAAGAGVLGACSAAAFSTDRCLPTTCSAGAGPTASRRGTSVGHRSVCASAVNATSATGASAATEGCAADAVPPISTAVTVEAPTAIDADAGVVRLRCRPGTDGHGVVYVRGVKPLSLTKRRTDCHALRAVRMLAGSATHVRYSTRHRTCLAPDPCWSRCFRWVSTSGRRGCSCCSSP